MTTGVGTPPAFHLSRVDITGTVVLFVSMLALGFLGSSNTIFAVLVPTLGMGLSTSLRALSPSERLRGAAIFPALIAAGLLSLLAANALLTEALAGIVGLALLAWWSWDPVENHRPRRSTMNALRLPVLALALGLVSSLLLPRSEALVGVATALIVGVLVYVAWLLTHPREVQAEQATPS